MEALLIIPVLGGLIIICGRLKEISGKLSKIIKLLKDNNLHTK
jgi:hypothetical protein